jgi:hypothetical protein
MKEHQQKPKEENGGARDGAKDSDNLEKIDRKIINKPTPYDGTRTKFPSFQDDLLEFLELQDPRWKPLLGQIEAIKGPMVAADTYDLAEKFGRKLSEFQQQLLMYLKSFTSGTQKQVISNGGFELVFGNYRQMCALGRSRRPEHILELKTKPIIQSR